MKNKVFLGGTCAETTWRGELIPLLDVDYFNPIVEDWTEECQAIEIDEKNNKCSIHLYLITSAMKGVFSIAEAVQSSNQEDKITIFQVDPIGFDGFELKSLKAVAELIKSNGGRVIMSGSLEPTVEAISKAVKDNWLLDFEQQQAKSCVGEKYDKLLANGAEKLKENQHKWEAIDGEIEYTDEDIMEEYISLHIHEIVFKKDGVVYRELASVPCGGSLFEKRVG